MRVTIDWGALGIVCLVSFGTAVGVIVLFALGVSALATPAPGSATVAPGDSAEKRIRNPWAWPVGMLCFLSCALVVVYGLYLIIMK